MRWPLDDCSGSRGLLLWECRGVDSAPRHPCILASALLSRRRGENTMKVIIVGGVAGGASCAARLRRLDERAEIIMVERGPYVSYANCGLPYHVGGVIPKESSLLVASEQFFRQNFNIDVRTNCEAISISPKIRQSICATSRPAKSPPNPTTSWCCRRARLRFILHCPASICPGSSMSGPCPTPRQSWNGSNAAPRSSLECIAIRAFRW